MKQTKYIHSSKINAVRQTVSAVGAAFAIFAATSLTSCVKDDLYDTPHPGSSSLAITAFFAAATLALAACNNDNEYVDNGPVAVQVTATIGENAMTRASNTSWAAGDKIGITTLRKGESKYINMEYTTEKGDGVFTGNTMYCRCHHGKREKHSLAYPLPPAYGRKANQAPHLYL